MIDESERLLKARRTGVGLKTMVRLAYKSMRMEVPYSKEDPDGETFMDTSEKIDLSHKTKIGEINEKLGTNSPFSNYKIKKQQQ